MKIYLVNRLKRKDTLKKEKDEWVVNEIDGCKIKTDAASSISEKRVNRNLNFTLLIPFTGRFKSYAEWIVDKKGYTINTGDLVFLDVPFDEETKDNYTKLHNKREDRSFEIKGYTIVEKKFGVRYQIKATG